MKTTLAAAVALMCSCMTVQTTDSPRAGPFHARDDDCPIAIFRLEPPKQQYRETGSALLEGSVFVTPAMAERELRARACARGADGIVLTKEVYGIPGMGSLVQAVFVNFTAQSARPESSGASSTGSREGGPTWRFSAR